MSEAHFVVDDAGLRARVVRELHTILTAIIVALSAFLIIRGLVPGWDARDFHELTIRYIGPSRWFFACVALFITWAVAAWVVDLTGLGALRNWRSIGEALHWAFEASPIVGLLATFISFLQALLVYSAAGPGKAETQQAFIEQFAIAFGSSICGGIVALIAFTLHKMLPDD